MHISQRILFTSPPMMKSLFGLGKPSSKKAADLEQWKKDRKAKKLAKKAKRKNRK